MKASLIILCILALYSSTVCACSSRLLEKLQKRDGQEQNVTGQPLAGMIGDVVQSPVLDFMLGDISPGGGKSLWRGFHQTTGYNVEDPQGRKALAIRIYGIETLEQLASLLKVSPRFFGLVYQDGLDQMDELGGYCGIKKFAKVLLDAQLWMIKSGFPALPLKEGSLEEVEVFMTRWQKEIYGIHTSGRAKLWMTERARDVFLPITLRPDFIGLAVRESHRTYELLDHLGLKRERYNAIIRNNPEAKKREIAELIVSLTKIIHELKHAGLLSLAPDVDVLP